MIKAVAHFGRGHRFHPRSGQLDRQRYSVETTTNLRSRRRLVSRQSPSALCEQLHGRIDFQRRDPPQSLADQTESLTARRQDLDCGRMRDDGLDQIRRGIDDVLAVVEYQQADPALQRGRHGLAHCLAWLLRDAEHRRHRVGYRCRIDHRCQLENPNAVWEFIGQNRGNLESQPGFTDSTHSRERDQPLRSHRRRDPVDVGVATGQPADGGA